MFPYLIIFAVILFLAWWLRSTRHPKDFPPGPRFPLPFLGDFLALKGDVFEGPEELRRRHGDIWGLWLGPCRTVYIHDYETLKVGANKRLFFGVWLHCK